jgi:hypothetical protein
MLAFRIRQEKISGVQERLGKRMGVILVMLPTKWARLFLITILLGGVFTSAWLQSGSLH